MEVSDQRYPPVPPPPACPPIDTPDEKSPTLSYGHHPYPPPFAHTHTCECHSPDVQPLVGVGVIEPVKPLAADGTPKGGKQQQQQKLQE